MRSIDLELSNRQSHVILDLSRVRRAAELIFAQSNNVVVQVSLSLVDDAEMGQLNQRHLGHDETTDVLSFVLEDASECLEVEIIANAAQAAREASTQGWTAENELLLYIVHGMLHAAGMDDLQPDQREAMFACQRNVMMELGVSAETVDRTICVDRATSSTSHIASRSGSPLNE